MIVIEQEIGSNILKVEQVKQTMNLHTLELTQSVGVATLHL